MNDPGDGPPSTVEGILEALRRGQRQLTSTPRTVIDGAVRQLLAPIRSLDHSRASSVPPTDSARTAYRIDDLARISGVTVRNIRAYQERGLLHAPERRGRIVVFDDSHVSRLRIITSMLERGYSTTHILEMLHAWEHGRDLADVLGLEQALAPPNLEDAPLTVSLTEARERAGGPEGLEQLIAAGLAERRGTRVRLHRPRLIEAFAEMRDHGMALDRLVELHLEVSAQVDRITRVLVAAGVEQLADQFVSSTQGTEDIERMVALLTRFRTLALTSVTASLSSSIEHSIEGLLADYLAAQLSALEADENVF